MAVLDNASRTEAWAEFMRELNRERETLPLNKTKLCAAVDAADDWIEANAVSFNTTLPVAARTKLTARQKARLFFRVAAKRFGVT